MKTKQYLLAGLLWAILFAGGSASAWAAVPAPPSNLREPGAIYLSDFVRRPVRLLLPQTTPVYFTPSKDRTLGLLKPGQTVEVQAITDDFYRVLGQAQQGQVAGWVEPRFLPPLKDEFLASLRQNAARRAEVESLIANNEVAVNMTPDEVRTSLGKPNKKTSKIDGGGRQEVWEYIRYERVPQQSLGRDVYGRIVSSVYYIRVPSGKLSIVFDKNLVSSLEQSEGTLEGGRAKIISAPLVFAF